MELDGLMGHPGIGFGHIEKPETASIFPGGDGVETG